MSVRLPPPGPFHSNVCAALGLCEHREAVEGGEHCAFHSALPQRNDQPHGCGCCPGCPADDGGVVVGIPALCVYSRATVDCTFMFHNYVICIYLSLQGLKFSVLGTDFSPEDFIGVILT